MSAPGRRHRTTVILPVELLEEAKREARTRSATGAVVTALQEFVAAQKRRRLLELDLPDLTLDSLERMRRNRVVNRRPTARPLAARRARAR